MSVIEAIKNHPWKSVIASSSSIIAIVTALFALDSRYAHAADVQKDIARTERVVQETSLLLRKQMLEDKLFELDIKRSTAPNGKLTPVESALRERYIRQISEINAAIPSK